MKPPPLEILYEDNHLLVVNKPAGLPTMGVSPDKPSLLTVAKDYVKHRYQKPGNVYLGILSRLDAPVTGVVLLARTSKAARRLTEQFRERSVEKTYWALVEGALQPHEGTCENWLVHDERHRRMHVVGPTMPGAQHARLAYRRLAMLSGDSLLEVTLETGRKHQIRLQLAERGHPILGDRKYGSRRSWPVGIALHARRLTISHPTGGNCVTFEAKLPAPWCVFGLPDS
ncbi:MAG: RluA family pseudouridine synthase [Pirellulaceae bacterium]|nr:RluA family pseudouridine synthase [Pirellulaceae bacterium]